MSESTKTSLIYIHRGGSRDFKGGVHNQRYTCIHHTECPSLEGGSKSGMITQTCSYCAEHNQHANTRGVWGHAPPGKF